MGTRYWPILLAALLAQPLHAEVLKRGTLLPVRLTENVNGNINRSGQTVHFQLVEDVYAGDALVLRKGTFIKGRIKDAVGRKSLGKGGELTLIARSLRTENNEVIRFVEDEMSAEGRKRTGATVAHVVVWGPLGLFAKGRAAFIMLDSEYDIEVDEDVELQPLEPQPPHSDLPRGSRYGVSFAKYGKTINYRKGKVHRDFTLYVADGGEPSRDSVTITHVLGYPLPEPLEPVSVEYQERQRRTAFDFAFTDMIKYIVPGTSDVLVRIEDEIYETQLTTEWKLD